MQKKRWKKNVACILIAVILITLLSPVMDLRVYAAEYSDSSLFGVWNGTSWKTIPKLDYSYEVDGVRVLETLEEKAKAAGMSGDYRAAKEELFAYLKQRTHITAADALTDNTKLAELATRNTFTGPGADYLIQTVSMSASPAAVTADVTVEVEACYGFSNNVTFMLMGAYNESSIARINSRENENNKPFVRLEFEDGTEAIVYPDKDTYNVGGTTANNGTATELLVRDTGTPIKNDNYRTYLNFNFSGLDVNKKVKKSSTFHL